MKFGKFEIDEWVLYVLLIVILIGIVANVRCKSRYRKRRNKAVRVTKRNRIL